MPVRLHARHRPPLRRSALALEFSPLPERLRGCGQVREQHAEAVARKREALLAQWQQGSAAVVEVKRRTQAA